MHTAIAFSVRRTITQDKAAMLQEALAQPLPPSRALCPSSHPHLFGLGTPLSLSERKK